MKRAERNSTGSLRQVLPVSVIWMAAAEYVRKFNYPALDETETAPYYH